MKGETPHTEEILRRSWSSASQEQIDTASHRVLHHLRSQGSAAAEESDVTTGSRRLAVACVAAAILLSAFVVWAAVVRQSPLPAVKRSEALTREEPDRLALLLRPTS